MTIDLNHLDQSHTYRSSKRQNEFRSIFGGENDVHQDKGERLRHIITTLYVCVAATLDLAPSQGASPRICDERHHLRVKTEHERFFFRDISASVHAAENRANPRDQRIAEPLSAFTVPLLPGPQEHAQRTA